MSAVREAAVAPVRRVRHGVRDGLALMAFSLGTSILIGLMLTVLAGLGQR
ncbi:MAG: hypothetical protein NTV23_14945 [Propionibacteriales bacterium]|nr:hypothetical protein [Propionibacteriales bacterium]